ncbi:MAG: hypothetical protein J0H74_35420 [Chitinophagaceae bacterium]|nr:hypothetical protein [Chitinophagaceae bacterium]
MSPKELQEEKAFLQALGRRDIKAFIRLYKEYGEDILILTYSLLQDAHAAAKMVDQFFEKLWEDTDFESIDPPIYKYLSAEIRKMCEQ